DRPLRGRHAGGRVGRLQGQNLRRRHRRAADRRAAHPRAYPQDQPEPARGSDHHSRSRVLHARLAGSLRLRSAQRPADRGLSLRRGAPRHFCRFRRAPPLAEGSIAMIDLASSGNRGARSFREWVLGNAAAMASIAAWAISTPAAAQVSATDKIPELASSSFAWLANRAEWSDPPAGLRGPIKNDPEHPYHGNLDGPGQVTVRMGNWRDPVLKPWAAAQMRASNEEVLSGKRQVPFTAQAPSYPRPLPAHL